MRLWDRNLPGEVIWQFSNEFTYAPGLFQCSSCTQKDRKRRKVVVISVGVGCGRVPSANPIQCGRDQDLYRQLPFACQVGLRFRADRGILHGPFESAGRSQFWSTPSSAVQTKTRTLYLTEPSNP